MSNKKSISGIFANSSGISRKTVIFDEDLGIILEVLENQNVKADYFFDESCIIFSGFGDIHIHAREDVTCKHCHKEDFLSATNAAINGGVLYVADMPNNPVPPVDDKSYHDKFKLTEKAPIPIFLYAGIGPSTKPLSYSVPYKVFMGPSIGELFFKDDITLEETLDFYKNQNVSFHCEDPIILENHKNELLHEDRRPKSAEIRATKTALKFIKKYNLSGKLCHYSTGEGLDLIRESKKEGVKVTCEVTPTHLYFDRNNVPEEKKVFFQMNPPLREESDVKAMVQGVLDGTIDYLATDHAPHTIEENQKGISGIPQLDTYSLFVTYMIKTLNIPITTIAKICSENPGKFVEPYLNGKYGKGFGKWEPGYLANFTVLNLNRPDHFTKNRMFSKSGWSPFDNFLFPGSIESVFWKGKPIKPKGNV
jgi:dihydroorotase